MSTPGQDEAVRRVVVRDDYHGYRMPVPSTFTNNFFATVDEKWAVLESIGIERRGDVSPLVAWRDAVADETGVDRAELDPRQGGYLDLGFTPMHVRKFVMFLA